MGKTVVASVAMESHPCIRGGLVMTTIDALGDVWVEIANGSPISRELNKWDQVGRPEECEIICQLLRFVTT